jgi:chromosomal replication initiation ATPase DnaA
MIATLEAMPTVELHRELARRQVETGAPSTEPGRFAMHRKVVTEVAHAYEVRLDRLMGRCRWHSVARARMVAMFLMHKLFKESFSGIGRFMHRDHSTVLYAVAEIDRRRLVDVDLNDQLRWLEAKVRP